MPPLRGFIEGRCRLDDIYRFLLRWAAPIVSICRPFGALSRAASMLYMDFCFDGLHPSLVYAAPSGLYRGRCRLVVVSRFLLRWASPIVNIYRPFGTLSRGVAASLLYIDFCFDGLHPSLVYDAPSGLYRGRCRLDVVSRFLLRWASPIVSI